jgi:hypothetical protein
MDGHKKVYEVTDNSGSSAADLLEYYDIQSNGTIEFWCRFTSATAGNYYRLRKEAPLTLGPTLNIYLNEFLFTNSSGSYPIPGAPIPQVNTWYHVRFDFRGSYPYEYSGLTSQYSYFIYINMIRYGPFTYEESEDVGTFHVHTSVAGSGFTIWWDAVGYSWDPNYNIGDNLNEGLLLSYDNTTNLDWQSYSLDGTSNSTILGNTTIPMPSNGQHRLHIFGNDTMGTVYSSNPRWFTIETNNSIEIVTPENRTYTEPDRGFYLNTYGFEDDEIGSNPNGWEITSGAGTGEVISEMMGHSRVLDLYDTSSSLEIWGVQTWEQPQSYGTVELWFYMSDFSKRVTFYCIDTVSDTGPVSLLWRGDLSVWKYAVGNTWYTYSGLPDPIAGWNHLTIHFERTTGNYQGLSQNYWKAVLNDYVASQRQLRYNFNPNQIRIASCTSHYNYHIYVDAIGYSWDPNYSTGDDLKEGLLLSYDTNITLAWQRYSLDGASIKTIFGNTVIPFPVNGKHTIRVFGNDSLGNPYESNLRYFSIDSTIPYISIVNPPQYSYFSREAPFFQLATSGENLSTTFYQVGGVIFFCETNQGRINQALWEGFAEGLLLINFYVNNTLGNYSMAQLAVYKDTISPYVSIRYYYEGRVYDTMAPHFYLNNYDENLDLTWYTLNDDFTKHYFIGDNFGIDQALWDNLDDGIVNITIYANDKAGNEGALNFYVIKDTSNINPYSPTYYPPYLAITIGGIVLLGVAVSIIVIILNKKSLPRTRLRHYEQIPYHSQPVMPKQYEHPIPKRILKCPYCSFEKDIDGNFCPRCGARLK